MNNQLLSFTSAFAIFCLGTSSTFASDTVSKKGNESPLYIKGKNNSERWKWTSKNLQVLASADKAEACQMLNVPATYQNESKVDFIISTDFDKKTNERKLVLLEVRFGQGKVISLKISHFSYSTQAPQEVGPS